MSKFGGRTSEEHHRDSPKHTALKEETRNTLETLRETSTDYDWDFWLSWINDVDLVLRTQPEAVKHHMTLGMPPSLRGQLWQIGVRSRNTGDVESEYRELLKRVSPDEKLIRRDLSRTFPTHEFFKEQDGEGQEALFNVIKAYSIFDQQVGYCQGLPFIVGCLLLEMREEHAFAVLIKLMSQNGLRSQYTPNMETLHERLYQFDHILQQKIPQVHRHLETQGVRPSMYASQWFLTLFASRCPLPLTVRIFDLIMVEGTLVVLRVALALLWRSQDTLLTLDMEHLVGFLNHTIYDAYVDDPNALVQDTYQIDIPTRLLNRLAKQRTTEAAREAKAQTQEEHLRRINTDLSQHVHRLEKANRTLETENRDVTQQVIDAKMSVARLDDENQQLRHELGQVRSELEQLKSTLPALEEMTRQNAYYRQQNQDLQSQLTDVEEILVDLKLKYAESEGRYEELHRRLGATGH
ncbi:rab-GTPase-TBC domain-domain-containing protein [Syncephalastrum racemosum]|uniref:Rab-GTPase-TBC domain-domain-containing protein n=1 Tax=Syncephalastrum racemosum TaxID=13706 RepID=A0A1X2H6G3_SYNRA|nr:rab-GTPase-TBC domain-domain-containing protein [Syncephalastrum racemosum]